MNLLENKLEMYREISEETKRWIAANFRRLTYAEMRSQTGCSTSTILRISREMGVEKTMEDKRRAAGKIYLTLEQEAWLRKNYPGTENFEIAEHLEVSEATMHRMARRLGLKKSRAYMRRCQKEAVNAAHYFSKRDGTGPKKGVYNENLQKGKGTQFKAGVNNRQRNGDFNEAMRLAKAQATRRQTVEKERERIRIGIAQKTKLKLTNKAS